MSLIDRLTELVDRLATGKRLPDAAGAEAVVREAIARLPKEDWQPIETAPKDEQRLLLFNPDESMGSWAFQTGAYYEQLGGWQYDGQNRAYSNAHQPTHWMPLPAAPVLPQRASGEK